MKEKKRTLGLYVHIPFCVRKCNYCDFLSFSATEEVKEQYVQALCNEIKSFSDVKNVDFDVTTI
ncbi:MAG: coproporphyrinogen III oxidase, partial [Clostridiales bacterium]|nr:coproporphyrinogen III oxidase [Clostridiales bacterium]